MGVLQDYLANRACLVVSLGRDDNLKLPDFGIFWTLGQDNRDPTCDSRVELLALAGFAFQP